MAIYTLQAISSKIQHFPRSKELNQTGDPKVLAISKVSTFPCHFYYASKLVTSLTSESKLSFGQIFLSFLLANDQQYFRFCRRPLHICLCHLLVKFKLLGLH